MNTSARLPLPFPFRFLIASVAVALLASCSGGASHGIETAPDPDPPSPDPRSGYVAVRGAGDSGAFAFAHFSLDPTDDACDYVGAVGTCAVVNCPSAGTPTSGDAGSIDVVAQSMVATLAYAGIAPNGSYGLKPFSSQPSDLPASTLLQFTGHGGRDVSAFMQTATMPPPLVPTSAPVMSGGAIDTSSDLAVAWTPLPFGDAVLTIGGPLPPEYGVEVVCFFDATVGAGTVPSAMLAKVASYLTGGNGLATFVAMDRSVVAVGSNRTVTVLGIAGDDVANAGVPVVLQ